MPTGRRANQLVQIHQNATERRLYVFTGARGSPFVQSRRTGFRCRSPRPELWLRHTAGRVEAPGRRRAGWTEGGKLYNQKQNCCDSQDAAMTGSVLTSYHVWGADGCLIAFWSEREFC